MTEFGYAYISGSFSNSLNLLNKSYRSVGSSDAFLAKVNTSSLSVADYFTLQSPELDKIDSILNYTGNQLLLFGTSDAGKLKEGPSFSSDDPFLISLRNAKGIDAGGEMIGIHPLEVDHPLNLILKLMDGIK